MTLWVFGDSYAEYYPDIKNQWMKTVADKLDTGIQSFGLVGTSIEYTFKSFYNVRNKIKENDIVIISLTTHNRRWFFKSYPSHSASPAPCTDYKNPVLVYHTTGFQEIDDSLSLYEELLNNKEIPETYLQNFLYNLNSLSKKLNLHTIIIINFYDTNYLLDDKKELFDNINFANGIMIDVSLNEFTKDYLIEYSTSFVDVRKNHLIKSNHDILAAKIIENIKNKTEINLNDGFIKQILSKEKLQDKKFISEQLFGDIVIK